MNQYVQVRQAKLEEGEQQFLRARLRQLEARRSSVERAGLVHLAVSGEGGVGGVVEALRNLEGHVDAILAQEEAHTGAKATGQNVKDQPELGAVSSDIPCSKAVGGTTQRINQY